MTRTARATRPAPARVARLVRAEFLTLKERDYVVAARSLGATDKRIIFRHILPNVLPLAFLYMTFRVTAAILVEAALSFLGFGDPNNLSWGGMLYNLWISGKIRTAWWWFAPPAVCIVLLVSALVFVSRAYEEVANPRLRKR